MRTARLRLKRVEPWWALLEAVVLALALLGVLWIATGSAISIALLQTLMLVINPLCIGWCALRGRDADGSLWRRILADLPVAAVLALALGGLLGVLLVASGSAIASDLLWLAIFGGLVLVFYGGIFVTVRNVLRFVQWWNHLRRTRFVWALTHAILMAFIFVVLTFTILFLWSTDNFGRILFAPFNVQGGGVIETLATLLVGTIPAIFILIVVLGVVCFFGALPAALLFSYLFVRRTTARLERLAAAATALGQGDYSARVAVSGEDEIARLQTTFNTMAADLEQTLATLARERDTVGGLLESRRQLIASVSHELRTPVATLRGYLDSALGRWDNAPPHIREDIAVMERETARLQRLIDELFTLSRSEVGTLTLRCVPTDAAQIVRQTVATLAPLAWRSGRVEVIADMPADLPLAQIDAARWEQILLNLLNNAVRHTPPGGIVAVTARAEEQMVVFEVRDTGVGIDPADLPHIWERFYRAGSSGGTGLGLALVKELAFAMGGTVAVTSTLGQGSIFEVHLPRANAVLSHERTTVEQDTPAPNAVSTVRTPAAPVPASSPRVRRS
jgi:signal transduction histidine kinase